MKKIKYKPSMIRQSMLKKPRYTLNQKTGRNIFSKDSSAVFISLAKDSFGIIKNVSNSFETQFRYSKQDILGKSCSLVMPGNIAVVHDSILSNFIRRGSFNT